MTYSNNPQYNSPYGGQFQPQPEPKNALGIAALICALIGLLFGLVPFTGFVAVALGLAGLVLGLAGWGRIRKNRATNRKTTIAGTVLSAAAIALGIWGIVIVFQATDELVTDLEDSSNQWAEYSDCIDANPPEDWDRCDQLDR